MRRYLCSMLPVLCLAITLAGCRRAAPTAADKADTPENRLKAARQYIARVPASAFVDAAIHELAAQREGQQREEFKKLLKRELRPRIVEEAIVQALTRHFTPAEINALAEFNSSPEGQSIQNGLSGYMADVLPPVRSEIARVLSMTNAAMAQLVWKARLLEANASIVDAEMTGGFAFLNQGTRPVNILSVTSTCACISGTASGTNFPPQSGGIVKMRFDFETRTGPHSKYLTVLTDDPVEPAVRLQMDILIPEVVRLEPPFARWTVGTAGTAQVSRVTLLNAGTTIEGIECSNALFRAEWRGTPSGNGEVWVTPASTAVRGAGEVNVLVRVSTNTVRRFPVFLAVSSARK